MIEQYEYDAFGGVSIFDASFVPRTLSVVGNRFMFTGREFDQETGLYYYRARYYSPELGRFMQTDPIGYYDSMNLYQYCLNNPVNYVDPLGNIRFSPENGLIVDVRFSDKGWNAALIFQGYKINKKIGRFEFDMNLTGVLNFRTRRDPYLIETLQCKPNRLSISGKIVHSFFGEVTKFVFNFEDISLRIVGDPNQFLRELNKEIPALGAFNASPSKDALYPIMGTGEASLSTCFGKLVGLNEKIFIGDLVGLLRDLKILK